MSRCRPRPDTFIYLSATRGFKSGGFNPTANRTGLAYAPESVWSYEGGLKRTMAGGRVRVNTAAFYSDYQDLQVQTLVQTGIFFVSTGAATIKGLEVETVAAAGRGLQVMGQFSWLDATFDRFLAVRPGTPPEEVDVPGNHLTYVPEWAGSGSAVYQFAIGNVGDDVPPRRSVLAGACVLHGVQRRWSNRKASMGSCTFEPPLSRPANGGNWPSTRATSGISRTSRGSTQERPFPDTTVGPASHASGARNSQFAVELADCSGLA